MIALFVLLVCASASSRSSGRGVPSLKVRGVSIPLVGLGVGSYGQLTPPYFGEYWNDTVCAKAVSQFLQLGGRRIDSSLKW
jgi:hypothetical protein